MTEEEFDEKMSKLFEGIAIMRKSYPDPNGINIKTPDGTVVYVTHDEVLKHLKEKYKKVRLHIVKNLKELSE